MPSRAASAVDPRSPVIRSDPLAAAYARNRIDHAQYLAGREFQRCMADPDEEANRRWLAKAHRELGQDGSAIVHDALIRGLSARQIAELRGMANAERYFTKRLYGCLDCLAEVFGFSR